MITDLFWMHRTGQTLLRDVPEGRRDLARFGTALTFALLPLPIGGLLSLAADDFTPPDWLVTPALSSQSLFPGMAVAAQVTAEAVIDSHHLFDIGMAISGWSLVAALIALSWAYLRGSGLATTNLRRPRTAQPWEPSGFRALLGGVTCLILLVFCWATAVTTLFHDGGFFIDAHKTCSYAIGTGRNEHCIRYDFLPLSAALWKLGWTTGLGNLALIGLTAGSWLLLAVSRARSRRRTS